MSLHRIRTKLIDDIKYNLSVVAEAFPIQDVGAVLEEASGWFQSLGICNLLLFADPERLCENLLRSGHTRRYFLRRSSTEGNRDDFRLAISRWESFFDVVAAGDFGLAEEIVSLSTSAWVEDGEYEDDFCYRRFLHEYIHGFGEGDTSTLEATLERFETWLDGEPSTRHELCVSMLERDEPAFLDTFERLVEEWSQASVVQRQEGLIVDVTSEPRSHIFIEGLAILQIAQRSGFKQPPDYLPCPEIARTPPTLSPVDIFEQL